MAKNLPAVLETRVQSLGQEDSLEKGMATPSNFSSGKSYRQRSSDGYSSWSHKDLDRTEQLTLSLSS